MTKQSPTRLFMLMFAGFLIFIAARIVISLGLFTEPENLGVTQASFIGAYKLSVGPYHKVGSLFEEMEKLATKVDVDCSTTFGIYLDNPEKVDHERLRAHVGCLIKSDEEFQALVEQDKEVQFMKLSEQKYLKMTFDGSPAAGPLKVYPAAQKWFTDNGYKFPEQTFETYKKNGREMQTFYFFSLKD